ncbi:MAG: hypothetical protein LBS33_05795 [Streptococcaceae bacterium]|jgi:hypothetical protein|nr:hypothetical protein [Streptococcaceae bacterium]
MEELYCPKETVDLIFSEGAIDAIGFEKGLKYWYQFIKKDSYVAVTCPSGLSRERPKEVEKFWSEAGSSLDSVDRNISIMQEIGFSHIATFVLPEKDWTENYFIPRAAGEEKLLEKYAGNQLVSDYVAQDKYEARLYQSYQQSYGYVFYIGKKLG